MGKGYQSMQFFTKILPIWISELAKKKNSLSRLLPKTSVTIVVSREEN